MKPAAFIQGLLNDVTRSDVVEDAALLNTRVSKYTITAYNQAAVFAKSHKTTSRAITAHPLRLFIGHRPPSCSFQGFAACSKALRKRLPA